MAILAGLLLAAAAPGWVANNGALPLTRSVAPVTITYRTAADDDDKVRLTVDHCPQESWYMEFTVVPEGDTPEQRAAEVAGTIAMEFDNARRNCALPDDIEARMMEGFAAAYVRMDGTRK